MSLGSRYDAWLTTPPNDWDPPEQRHCSNCGGFLPYEPSGIEVHETSISCDGRTVAYEVEYNGAMQQILQKEPGATYTVNVAPCGGETDHEPHVDVIDGGFTSRWDCRKCGSKTLS